MSVRLTGLSRPAVALLAVVAGLYGVGRTTGSGWLMVILSAVAGVGVVAVALPVLALRRAQVEVSAPQDGTVGRPLELQLRLHRAPIGKARAVAPAGEWFRVLGAVDGPLRAVPDARGVLSRVSVELSTATPLGLVWAAARVTVELEHPLEIGPQPLDAALPPALQLGTDGDGDRRRPVLAGDLVRGVRVYAPGDARKLVDWRATARAGELMVKDLEGPTTPSLGILVDLRGPATTAEQTASEAAGLALRALGAGLLVTLLTVEREGAVVGTVDRPVEVGRRLARAVGGAAPPDGPLPAGCYVVRVGPSRPDPVPAGGRQP